MDRRPCMSQSVRYSLFGESTVEATNYKIIARDRRNLVQGHQGAPALLVLVSQARLSFSFFFKKPYSEVALRIKVVNKKHRCSIKKT